MSELVTGEAVVLDLRLARLASRGLAFALDAAIQLFALFILLLIFSGGSGLLDSAASIAIALVLVVLVMIGYPVLLETLTRGRSVGKLAMGLRVVREDGGPIRFRQALIRGLTGFFVDFWVLGVSGAVAIFTSLASKKAKRVGDFLAGTVVIHERMPRESGAMVGMPPGMAAWAATLNVAAVPDGLALTVRQYLGRYTELNDVARDSLGAQLAGEVSGYIGVALPQDATSVHYLAAVLAERRNREHIRLQPPPAAPPPPVVPPAQPQQPAPESDNPFTAPS
jgi:uncharacterized RDD family membrane protein YckC